MSLCNFAFEVPHISPWLWGWLYLHLYDIGQFHVKQGRFLFLFDNLSAGVTQGNTIWGNLDVRLWFYHLHVLVATVCQHLQPKRNWNAYACSLNLTMPSALTRNILWSWYTRLFLSCRRWRGHGPLRYTWCMRFESKNKQIKELTSGCFKNVVFSIPLELLILKLSSESRHHQSGLLKPEESQNSVQAPIR